MALQRLPQVDAMPLLSEERKFALISKITTLALRIYSCNCLSRVSRALRVAPPSNSMGGHGAIKLGMKYPLTFSVVYALKPSLLVWSGDVSMENPQFAGLSELQTPDDLEAANFYVQAIVGIGQGVSPNPENQPFLTDFPFQLENGKVVPVPTGFDRWQQQMPLYMIDTFADNLKRLRGLRFDSAFEDEYRHIPITSKAFSEALADRGIDHQFEMYYSDHRNRLWGRQGRLYTELLPYFLCLLDSKRDGLP